MMPPELQQLESELARLRPSPPTPSCEARIAARIEPVELRSDWREWRPLAQAAALVLTACCLTLWIEGGALFRSVPPATAAQGASAASSTQSLPPTTVLLDPAAQSRLLRPTSATQILLSAEPEGLVQMQDGSYSRRVRTRSVQKLEFTEESGNARISYSLPREDILLLPMVTY